MKENLIHQLWVNFPFRYSCVTISSSLKCFSLSAFWPEARRQALPLWGEQTDLRVGVCQSLSLLLQRNILTYQRMRKSRTPSSLQKHEVVYRCSNALPPLDIVTGLLTTVFIVSFNESYTELLDILLSESFVMYYNNNNYYLL